jgi:diaminohydroxyphosphoribosylaminopyrimidine deaminase / 5-amino-6-(5-phosphoribosylamino)uracil reductase
LNGERWAALMARALELAERGRYGASPNPMVGAVVLDRAGEVVGEGAHLRRGEAHAEVAALAAAGASAVGGTLVVTLEPCTHHGLTPPCVDAVIAARIARVVVGAHDPNPVIAGAGVARLREVGIEVVDGVEEAACRSLNRSYFFWRERGLPFVTLKMAMTLDGKLAPRGGRSQRITSEEARSAGYALREQMDALVVGVGTVLADDPRLLRHLGVNPNPHLRRVVLDSNLRTPATATLLAAHPEDVVIFCRDSATPERRRELEGTGATVVEVGGDDRGGCELHQVLRWLAGHEVSSVLVEGGGETHWSFLNEALAQEVVAFIAPLLLGGRDAVPAVGGTGFPSPLEGVRLRFVTLERLAEDVMIRAEVDGV